MSLLDAMKLFLCYLLDDGTTPGQITATSAAEIWVLMGEAFNVRFNGGAAIAALTVESLAKAPQAAPPTHMLRVRYRYGCYGHIGGMRIC